VAESAGMMAARPEGALPRRPAGWLVQAPSFGGLLAVELWLSFLSGSYMVVALTEIMPVEARTAGFSVAYSLATALFGGFTPAVSTVLIHVSDDKAMPGVWLSFAALCGLGAARLAGNRAQPAALAHPAA
jgi:MFS transporter, MHS family, citrate/tricarballylate:H+ symporter